MGFAPRLASNLGHPAKDPHDADVLAKMRKTLSDWTEQTGDTVPSNPTPHRDTPPRIEDGKLIPFGGRDKNFKHREMPGESAGAEKINHPGPVRLK